MAALRVRRRTGTLVADAEAVVREGIVRIAGALIRIPPQKKLLRLVRDGAGGGVVVLFRMMMGLLLGVRFVLFKKFVFLVLRAGFPSDASGDRGLVVGRLRDQKGGDFGDFLVVEAVHRIFRCVRAGD